MLATIVELLSLGLALAAILIQTRRDTNQPPSWKNLSVSGRWVLCLIVLAASAKIFKLQFDAEDQRRASAVNQENINQLKKSNADLLDINKHLIKVMSVSSGYSATVSGVVIFSRAQSETKIRDALSNLFLKYAQIDIQARNRLGTYKGKFDFGTHPEVVRFLSLMRIHGDGDKHLVNLRDEIPHELWPMAYYFDIRSASLKILNDEKIQYAQFTKSEPVTAELKVFPYWSSFQELYAVTSLLVESLYIQELVYIPIQKKL